MLINAILLVLQGVLNVLLSPLTVINIGVDFISSIPIVSEFLGIIAYVLPWTNLLPLIAIIVSIFIFRIAVALIRSVKAVIPFL